MPLWVNYHRWVDYEWIFVGGLIRRLFVGWQIITAVLAHCKAVITTCWNTFYDPSLRMSHLALQNFYIHYSCVSTDSPWSKQKSSWRECVKLFGYNITCEKFASTHKLFLRSFGTPFILQCTIHEGTYGGLVTCSLSQISRWWWTIHIIDLYWSFLRKCLVVLFVFLLLRKEYHGRKCSTLTCRETRCTTNWGYFFLFNLQPLPMHISYVNSLNVFY